ncbi:hypothetical protein EVAR_102236_1 [Eumeta japonica]|uniref:Uncharacterized protein n=1 Tax=Eumeta variegata TaxID=151549 RepID=A0A4C1WE06_EUMVA|nr:hypothetical protein EVAR_102236_1 [Eumeta japonica]
MNPVSLEDDLRRDMPLSPPRRPSADGTFDRTANAVTEFVTNGLKISLRHRAPLIELEHYTFRFISYALDQSASTMR